MTDRLVGYVKVCIDWITGKPAVGGKRGSWWAKMIELAIVVVLFAYLCIWGALMPFMPFSPGFKNVSDGVNRVYYEGDSSVIAGETLAICRAAQRSVVDFWNSPGGAPFPGGVDVYLCSAARFRHLAGFNPGTAITQGNNIIIDISRGRDRLVYLFKHELAHCYVASLTGQSPMISKFTVPSWLTEGLAVLAAGEPRSSEAALNEHLLRDVHLKSASGEVSYSPWQYAYYGSLVDYLERNYGKDKVLALVRRSSLFGDQAAVFSNVMGMSLADAEKRWLAEKISTGLVPASTTFLKSPKRTP